MLDQDEHKINFQHAVADIIRLGVFPEHYNAAIIQHREVAAHNHNTSCLHFNNIIRHTLLTSQSQMIISNLSELSELGTLNSAGFWPDFGLSETNCRSAFKIWKGRIPDLSTLGFQLDKYKLRILTIDNNDKSVQSIIMADTRLLPEKGSLNLGKESVIWLPSVDVVKIPAVVHLPTKRGKYKKPQYTFYNDRWRSREEIQELFGWTDRTMENNLKKFQWVDIDQ